MHQRSAVLIVALFATACSTTPTANTEATPADNVIPSSIMSTRPDAGRVVVRRDSGLLGVACGHAVRLDGKLIAVLSAGQEVTTYPAPGEHTLEASNSGAWCNANTPAGMSFILEAGQSKVFRTGFSGFDLSVSQLSESRAVAAPTATKAESARALPEEIKPRVAEAPAGKDAYQAEHLATVKACNPQPRAVLSAKGAGFETYMVACSNGDTLAVRCEFGNCRALR